MAENSTPNIIIIDDDSVNNLVTEMYIRFDFPDAEIKSYTDPEIAANHLKSDGPIVGKKSIVLLDINMPVLSGWDFLDLYRTFPEAVHEQFDIYMYTSSVAKEDKKRAEEHPYVKGFIEKPLSQDDLKKISSQSRI
jgi:CheY-like chemotaxis protein